MQEFREKGRGHLPAAIATNCKVQRDMRFQSQPWDSRWRQTMTAAAETVATLRLGKLRPVGEAETSVAYTEQLRDFS